jgi:hypothetical protein
VTIEEHRLSDEVTVVMGAGAVGPGWGNGRAIAVLFARHGAKVLVVDKDRAAADDTAQIIRAEGNSCEVAIADATNMESVSAAFLLCSERLGAPTAVVNNVGGSIPGGPLEMTLEEFTAQLNLNLTSAFVAAKVSIPYFLRGGRGSIVNIGSVGGARHLGHHHVGYSAGKAGLVQFTRQLAVQYGQANIRCNTVIPGLIDTPLLEHRVARQKGRLSLDALREEAKQRVPLGRRGEG